MWMSLSASRWICLLTLTVVMLASAAQAQLFQNIPCCYKTNRWIKAPIDECIEQTSRRGCRVDAYLVKTVCGHWRCISKDSKWLMRKMDEEGLRCPRDVVQQHILYGDDEE